MKVRAKLHSNDAGIIMLSFVMIVASMTQTITLTNAASEGENGDNDERSAGDNRNVTLKTNANERGDGMVAETGKDSNGTTGEMDPNKQILAKVEEIVGKMFNRTVLGLDKWDDLEDKANWTRWNSWRNWNSWIQSLSTRSPDHCVRNRYEVSYEMRIPVPDLS